MAAARHHTRHSQSSKRPPRTFFASVHPLDRGRPRSEWRYTLLKARPLSQSTSPAPDSPLLIPLPVSPVSSAPELFISRPPVAARGRKSKAAIPARAPRVPRGVIPSGPSSSLEPENIEIGDVYMREPGTGPIRKTPAARQLIRRALAVNQDGGYKRPITLLRERIRAKVDEILVEAMDAAGREDNPFRFPFDPRSRDRLLQMHGIKLNWPEGAEFSAKEMAMPMRSYNKNRCERLMRTLDAGGVSFTVTGSPPTASAVLATIPLPERGEDDGTSSSEADDEDDATSNGFSTSGEIPADDIEMLLVSEPAIAATDDDKAIRDLYAALNYSMLHDGEEPTLYAPETRSAVLASYGLKLLWPDNLPFAEADLAIAPARLSHGQRQALVATIRSGSIKMVPYTGIFPVDGKVALTSSAATRDRNDLVQKLHQAGISIDHAHRHQSASPVLRQEERTRDIYSVSPKLRGTATFAVNSPFQGQMSPTPRSAFSTPILA